MLHKSSILHAAHRMGAFDVQTSTLPSVAERAARATAALLQGKSTKVATAQTASGAGHSSSSPEILTRIAELTRTLSGLRLLRRDRKLMDSLPATLRSKISEGGYEDDELVVAGGDSTPSTSHPPTAPPLPTIDLAVRTQCGEEVHFKARLSHCGNAWRMNADSTCLSPCI